MVQVNDNWWSFFTRLQNFGFGLKILALDLVTIWCVFKFVFGSMLGGSVSV